MEITEQDLDKMKNVTILDMAQQLEEGLVHMQSLDEEMSVLEFVKHYLDETRSNNLEVVQKECPHNNIFRYNHGYHTICEDCGEEL